LTKDANTRSNRAHELTIAKRRASVAKVAFVASGTVLFGFAMVAARQAYAGHVKHPTVALSAPPRFVRVVKKNLLQAGVVGPAQAAPGAASAAS
jgi:hypothetical protein